MNEVSLTYDYKLVLFYSLLRYEPLKFGTGSPLLLLLPLPTIRPSANLIRRGRNYLQKSRDFHSSFGNFTNLSKGKLVLNLKERS